MPVPNTIDDLSTTAGSNSPAGSETPTEGDNYLRTLSSFIALLRDKLNGTSNTGTVKNATFSGTMAGAAAWSALQTFAAGIAGTTATMTGAVSGTSGTFSAGVSVGNAASATTTVLDYYLENTYTPAASGSTGAGTPSYTSRGGTYTRIGNRIFGQAEVLLSGITGASGSLVVTLPVTAKISAFDTTPVGHGFFLTNTEAAVCAVRALAGDGTKASFSYASGAAINELTASSSAAGATINFEFAYEAA